MSSRKIISRNIRLCHGALLSIWHDCRSRGQRALTDTYAVISIQDSHTQGFGVQFTENQFCKGVLTLMLDDIVTEIEDAVLFDDDMADFRSVILCCTKCT